ncbi:MAG TPA: thioredoxin family protein [Flavobacterium sp.]|nr:thioredoxin family protein [Flavobacterium sp.]
MKKMVLIAFFLIAGYSAQAQELTWHNDLSKASELAIKSKKPLLLFFTGSDWCGWCMRLQKEVLTTPDFAKWAKDNVVLVELDFPRRKQLPDDIKKQNADMEQLFGIRGYPTIWLVTPSNKDGKVSFDRLGSTGYVAGGPAKWLEGANAILANKK